MTGGRDPSALHDYAYYDLRPRISRILDVNVRGAWIVCTEGARQMIAEGHGGAIVMVSSISAHVGAPTQVAYCGTKGAISMLGKALGAVLGKHGIRVNVIEPGAVATYMSAELLSDPVDLGLELSHGHRVGQHLPPGASCSRSRATTSTRPAGLRPPRPRRCHQDLRDRRR